MTLAERFIAALKKLLRPLTGARVLEIGCGTGCSTVALAEQGAAVVAVDVAESGLPVARERCAVFRLEVEFRGANAAALTDLLAGRQFDLVIFCKP